LHLVGILFPHINDDAQSKSHQISRYDIHHSFELLTLSSMSVSLAAVLQLRAESMLVIVSLLRWSLAMDKSLFVPEPGGGVKVIFGG